MFSDKTKDLAVGVAVLLFAIGGFVFVNPTHAPLTEGPGGLSWRTIPFIYSGLLLALAVIYLVITAVRGAVPMEEATAEEAHAHAEADAEAHAPEPMRFGFRLSTIRRTAVIIALVVYSQAIGAFGFALSTPVFLYVLLHIFGRPRVRENAIVSVVGGLALWVLFDHLLKMPLRGDVWDPLSPALTAAFKAMGI